MKKLALVCAFVLGASAMTFAQNGGGGGNGGGGRGGRTPEQQVTRLKEQLTLTDAQIPKVTAILAAQAKVQDSLRTASNGDREAMRPKQAALRKATSDKIITVLTAEQATIYKKQLEEQAKAQAARQAGN
jgi:protein CpxP